MRKAFVEALSKVDDKGWIRTEPPHKPSQDVIHTEPLELDEIQWDESDESTDYDSSLGLSDVDLSHHDRTPPRMPRPSPIRQISGPGFTSSASSGSIRKRLSDDADFPDPDARDAKRQRSTPSRQHDTKDTKVAPTRTIVTRRFAATIPS